MATPVVTAEGFATYLEQAATGRSDVAVSNVRRIVGGASRVTYSLDARWSEGGATTEAGLIVRLDPPASLLDSNREHEYAAYRGMTDSDVPVPAALWIEDDASWFDGPFFVMQRIDGCETAPQRLMAPPFDAVAGRIGVELFEIAGRISGFDWAKGGWEFLESIEADRCWERELDRWTNVIERHRSDAQPIVRAAIDWMRRHPPPPAQRVAVVHGDYRTGNVLVDPSGAIQGVLDWEMCHLGDPIEDLAWTCMPNWRWGRPKMYGGFLEPTEALGTWERSSGLHVDPEAFHWWSLFAHVKAQGIWLTGARNFAEGEADAVNLPGISLQLSPIEDRGIMALLGWHEVAP
ncbi:MAG: phosphotransferase family protein [Chloroflexi bacterium]|nr:phosphotransferase family protein [Chloroflexota bacterium]MDA1147145.1 phosphotransferase family protein [Chloroflexota bacterium]